MDSKPKFETQSALSKMMALCSRGEKSIFDIQEKLRGWNIAEQDIESVINDLIKEKFLDQERFCRAYVRDKMRFNQWGKIKIKFMLSSKNISKELIDKNLAEIDGDEYFGIVKNVLNVKLRGKAIPEDYNQKMKIVASLSRKGFETDIIFDALKEIEKASDL